MPKAVPVEETSMAKPPAGPQPGTSPAIPDELVDQLLKGYQRPEDLLGPGGLIKQLMGRLISRAMDAATVTSGTEPFPCAPSAPCLALPLTIVNRRPSFHAMYSTKRVLPVPVGPLSNTGTR